MILTRHEISKLIEQKKLCFEPMIDAFQNQPHAVDLRLGTVFYLPKIWKLTKAGREVLTVDVTESAGDNFEKIELAPGQFFELAPGESVIASTLEKISLHADDVMGVLYPRSSINRRGLAVDMTGIVDAHYSGHLMIPVLNKTSSQVIRIYPGERICQIVFQRLETRLQKEDALRHGAGLAKYNGANAKELGSQKDTEEEVVLIKKGDFEGLKKHKF
ncbi:dCTP deaminase [Candidatus Gracilibacteria bacterium]|nr:dCTP deaminase [Candidatus Gracilibacteria bacterium]